MQLTVLALLRAVSWTRQVCWTPHVQAFYSKPTSSSYWIVTTPDRRTLPGRCIWRGHGDLHISVIGGTMQTTMQTVKGLARALSRAFGISVVAEAVETALQDSPLIELGCAWGQGFHDGAARCGPISHAGRTGLEGCPPAGG